MPRLLSLLLALFVLAAIPARSDIIRLVTLDYPPYAYLENGRLKGVWTALLQEAFRRTGHELFIDVLQLDTALGAAASGQADGVFCIMKTGQRQESLDFCQEPLFSQTTSFFVKKDAGIAYNGRVGSMGRHRFCVVSGASYGPEFDSAAKSGLLVKLVKARDLGENVANLLGDKCDVLVGNSHAAQFLADRVAGPGLVVELTPSLQEAPGFVAFTRKRDLSDLRQSLDAALAAMKRDGAYQRILAEELPR